MIRELYEINNGFFDPLFGSIELPKPEGEAKTFVICGNGTGILIPAASEGAYFFIAGVLYTNDVNYRLARLLADQVITEKPLIKSVGNLPESFKAMESCDRGNLYKVPVEAAISGWESFIKAAKKSRKAVCIKKNSISKAVRDFKLII